MDTFTEPELAYLAGPRLGRLATIVDAHGAVVGDREADRTVLRGLATVIHPERIVSWGLDGPDGTEAA